MADVAFNLPIVLMPGKDPGKVIVSEVKMQMARSAPAAAAKSAVIADPPKAPAGKKLTPAERIAIVRASQRKATTVVPQTDRSKLAPESPASPSAPPAAADDAAGEAPVAAPTVETPAADPSEPVTAE